MCIIKACNTSMLLSMYCVELSYFEMVIDCMQALLGSIDGYLKVLDNIPFS